MIRILLLAVCAACAAKAALTTAGLNIEYRGDAGGKSILVDSHDRPQPIAQK